MAYLSEKAAYLRGLADGLKIDEAKDEGKLLLKIIEVLDEMAITIDELDEEVAENSERLDDVEECLDEVCEDLDAVYDELDEMFDEDEDCCDCDGCDGCDGDYDDEYFDDDEDMEFYEVECDGCGEKVYFDEDMINDESLICPNCSKKIEIEFVEEEE